MQERAAGILCTALPYGSFLFCSVLVGAAVKLPALLFSSVL